MIPSDARGYHPTSPTVHGALRKKKALQPHASKCRFIIVSKRNEASDKASNVEPVSPDMRRKDHPHECPRRTLRFMVVCHQFDPRLEDYGFGRPTKAMGEDSMVVTNSGWYEVRHGKVSTETLKAGQFQDLRG